MEMCPSFPLQSSITIFHSETAWGAKGTSGRLYMVGEKGWHIPIYPLSSGCVHIDTFFNGRRIFSFKKAITSHLYGGSDIGKY